MKFCCFIQYNNYKKICIKCKKKLNNSNNKCLFYKISYELIQYIFLLYYKSKNMYYYSNISLVSKYFNYNFNILYKSFKFFKPFLYENFTNSIYYVKSTYYNIKFAKLYFHKTYNKFNLLIGEENMSLAEHKNISNLYHKLINQYYLIYFDFISI